jgi:hypothetical protein
MVIQTAKKQEQDKAKEFLMLGSVVPSAVKEFCDTHKISEAVLPESRMHDKDFAGFLFNIARGYPASASPMSISTFAAAVPAFPREKIKDLFAHVAKAVSEVNDELK